MDFPAQPAQPEPAHTVLAQALGAAPAEVLAGADWIAVFENAAQVASLSPDQTLLTTLDRRGVVATAPGEAGDADYVLRFFAPKNAVPEDPVTGNVQTALVPYWAARLGKKRLAARQLSARGGRMVCEGPRRTGLDRRPRSALHGGDRHARRLTHHHTVGGLWSASALDGRATGRDRGPPRMRRARAGAGRRPAAVSDKLRGLERFRLGRKRPNPRSPRSGRWSGRWRAAWPGFALRSRCNSRSRPSRDGAAPQR